MPTPSEKKQAPPKRHSGAISRASVWGYAASALMVALATAVSWTTLGRNELADVAMVYVFAVMLVSMRFRYGPSLVAAALAVLCFDFFFVPPYYTFAVAQMRHIATFAVMFLAAVVISGLTRRVQDQAEAARQRELRTASLYALSRELSAAKTLEEAIDAGERHVGRSFGGSARVELEVIEPGADSGSLRVPLVAAHGTLGALSVAPGGEIALDPEARRHLRAFADQIAAAIERRQLAEEAHRARLQIETEQLRTSLLSSVSHDLRTPLAIVTGAASSLLEDNLESPVRRELTETILQESERLNRLVQNLLDMTRLEAGALVLRKQWQPLEEVVGSALSRVEKALALRDVTTSLPDDPSLVPLDAVLIEQVLLNLLENAAKYTPEGTPITIAAHPRDGAIEVEVSDRGPGVPAGSEERVFEKFYRAGGEVPGAGLGLAICRGIVQAHGGRMWVEPREGGGASFRFTLPRDGEPPELGAGEVADAALSLGEAKS